MNSHLILPGTYASEEKVAAVCAKYDRIESEQELLKKRVEQLGSTLEAVSNQNSRLRRHTKWLVMKKRGLPTAASRRRPLPKQTWIGATISSGGLKKSIEKGEENG